MKIFTCQDHAGRWPVGTASLIFAETEERAEELLRAELIARHLSPDDFTLIEELPDIERAIVLRDGDY